MAGAVDDGRCERNSVDIARVRERIEDQQGILGERSGEIGRGRQVVYLSLYDGYRRAQLSSVRTQANMHGFVRRWSL